LINPRFGDAYLARAEQTPRWAQGSDRRLSPRRTVPDNSTRLAARSARRPRGAAAAFPPQAATTVYVHYVGEGKEDQRAADRVQRTLARDFKVAKVQRVPGGRTTGDVRYFVSEDKDQTARDERAAATVAKTVENTLAEAGFKLNLRVIALDLKRFPDAQPGVIESGCPR
jgi:hypothetical protein